MNFLLRTLGVVLCFFLLGSPLGRCIYLDDTSIGAENPRIVFTALFEPQERSDEENLFHAVTDTYRSNGADFICELVPTDTHEPLLPNQKLFLIHTHTHERVPLTILHDVYIGPDQDLEQTSFDHLHRFYRVNEHSEEAYGHMSRALLDKGGYQSREWGYDLPPEGVDRSRGEDEYILRFASIIAQEGLESLQERQVQARLKICALRDGENEGDHESVHCHNLGVLDRFIAPTARDSLLPQRNVSLIHTHQIEYARNWSRKFFKSSRSTAPSRSAEEEAREVLRRHFASLSLRNPTGPSEKQQKKYFEFLEPDDLKWLTSSRGAEPSGSRLPSQPPFVSVKSPSLTHRRFRYHPSLPQNTLAEGDRIRTLGLLPPGQRRAHPLPAESSHITANQTGSEEENGTAELGAPQEEPSLTRAFLRRYNRLKPGTLTPEVRTSQERLQARVTEWVAEVARAAAETNPLDWFTVDTRGASSAHRPALADALEERDETAEEKDEEASS